ncbi:UDP-N-acetylmuramoyl-L-alanyl-D-glutamate--L-lysine ligase [Enterococcus canintestini]|uniref:UDP-N-acetylmuramoyl-L-alanyl-D-glutamate--L- lysine ligase n=1 Tax=Enterococcus canintestini TaxID=317010 RepID=UPI00288FDA24|nr:UDP-N-acetylmuramoyl-L-alanyl-D-glutamate--L-lysine ligase [Enterococcus canintestini]MDT2740088.1 UDP-N-acetylmuramoyl-L-alanyl-D-glutamate--L-lysine ligase [Enterococcus canintestini]
MTLTLEKISAILLKNDLLKEMITPTGWHLTCVDLPKKEFSSVTYDSRKADANSLFFCKGLNFKVDYLISALANGLEVYVAEAPFDVSAKCAIIVTDIKKAMALLGAAFYDHPEKELKLVAFTGTKGKTTAAYFTHALLAKATGNKTALLSTMNTSLDGKTYFKSHLTTPESLDLYQMMRQAVTNKMTHLVMEVSSQAYKTERVFGLTFDVGIFLNISPDHISPIEHPTFDDYFYCKRQLLRHSKKMILNSGSDYFALLKENCELLQTPYISYGRKNADYLVTSGQNKHFTVTSKNDELQIAADYSIQLAGDFNQENATAALLAAAIVGADVKSAKDALATARVPGRMDHLINTNGASVYVDYAHNYLSLKTLLEFAQAEHPTGRVIVVLGSTGGKAISRRADFGKALSEHGDVVILTADDPAFEDPQKIAEEINAHITNEKLEVHFEMDRTKAIAAALALSDSADAVVIAGKGVDEYQKINGEDMPYEGDYFIAQRLIKENQS